MNDGAAAASGPPPAPEGTAPAPPSLALVAPLARLREAPSGFGFFQALRLLHHATGLDGARVGQVDPVRLGVSEHLDFPPSELHELVPAPEHGDVHGDAAGATPERLVVNFFGLTGPSGVLPHAYTRWLIERARRRDFGPRAFLEMFNHRLLLLFWHAWRKHRPDVELEFGSTRGLPRHLFDLVGMGTPTLFAQLHAHDAASGARAEPPAAALAYYSGLVAQRPHGVGAIAQVVGDAIGAPVQAHGCLGTWQPIPRADRTRLGRRAHALGDGCVLGARHWDRQRTLLLRVGPLDADRFARMLPDGDLLGGLVALARFLTGLALDVRVRLALRADQVPRLSLSSSAPRRARLGWNTWLGGRRRPGPAEQAQFHFGATGDTTWQ